MQFHLKSSKILIKTKKIIKKVNLKGEKTLNSLIIIHFFQLYKSYITNFFHLI